MDSEIVKACRTCGAKHTAEQFAALPPPTSGRYPTGVKVTVDESGTVTETYRNCGCGSTLMTYTES